MPHRWKIFPAAITLAAVITGCSQQVYDPSRASRPYPIDLHRAEAVDIQVFRDDTEIVINNATATTYTDFDIWVNQRYMRHVDSLPAGRTIRLSLWNFFDEYGENPNAGGFFRTHPATPVFMTEIQVAADQPLVGLITILPKSDS